MPTPSSGRSVFDLTKPADLDDYLLRCARYRPALDVERTRATALASIKALQTTPEGKELERVWYESLERGAPDFSVYDADFFIGDIWTCWVLFSRKYLLSLRKPNVLDGHAASVVDSVAPAIGRVVDLGCGFGYSTAGLKELFPEAEVFGTNLPETCQWQVASEVGAERGFRLVPDVAAIGAAVDLVFASEYFEHVETPVEHLEEVIRVATPKVFVFANTFQSPAVGHFSTYRHRGEAVAGTAIGRVFSSALRAASYAPVKTTLWNNRPAIWVRK